VRKLFESTWHLLSYSVFILFFPYFFVSGPCARLSWPSRQVLSARQSTVSYLHVSLTGNRSGRFGRLLVPQHRRGAVQVGHLRIHGQRVDACDQSSEVGHHPATYRRVVRPSVGEYDQSCGAVHDAAAEAKRQQEVGSRVADYVAQRIVVHLYQRQVQCDLSQR